MNDSGDSSICPSLIAEWSPNGTVIEYLANYPDTDIVPIVRRHVISLQLVFVSNLVWTLVSRCSERLGFHA